MHHNFWSTLYKLSEYLKTIKKLRDYLVQRLETRGTHVASYKFNEPDKLSQDSVIILIQKWGFS